MKEEKRIYRVNIENPENGNYQVGFGYRIENNMMRIKTINGIYEMKESQINAKFESKLLTPKF